MASKKAKLLREFYGRQREIMGINEATAQCEGYVVTLCDDEAEANALMDEIGLPGRPYRPEQGDILPRIESARIRRRKARLASRARTDVMKSLGLSRTRSGGWE